MVQAQWRRHRRNRNLTLGAALLLMAAGFLPVIPIWVSVAGFALVNVYAWVLMAWDKQQAIQHRFRIPEASLLLAAALGGGTGALLGMFVHRHKTKHLRFVLLVPLFTLIQILLLVYLWIDA
ncbi:DUF1294 domain-containing protein [Brevibacillus panacihumi]|uniref:DUF1294 domain-containing protein n=1 Tax=Brevibacillus panacihumi TaxID=497735 RepID=A0A3M8DEP6_9BACL|nr:DUF1294 domain-containing protein [Brevibacillus panacihumi]RNB86059.1 DUF1294 domain-containing protein [Brevibacillus panacihumi]